VFACTLRSRTTFPALSAMLTPGEPSGASPRSIRGLPGWSYIVKAGEPSGARLRMLRRRPALSSIPKAGESPSMASLMRGAPVLSRMKSSSTIIVRGETGAWPMRRSATRRLRPTTVPPRHHLAVRSSRCTRWMSVFSSCSYIGGSFVYSFSASAAPVGVLREVHSRTVLGYQGDDG
jgi:hypothetical protein